jgi:single-stranded-DNA-specific exonuclease
LSELILPEPSIKSRPTCAKREQEAILAGLDPILAKVIAGRPFLSDLPILEALGPKLKSLFSPFAMKDMQFAALRVAKAIQTGETIGIETDHDCDGQTSHAVLYYNLAERFHHPKEKIRSYIGHRLIEGYGLSSSVATRIIQDPKRPSLVITADNGSSDEPRIALLKSHYRNRSS